MQRFKISGYKSFARVRGSEGKKVWLEVVNGGEIRSSYEAAVEDIVRDIRTNLLEAHDDDPDRSIRLKPCEYEVRKYRDSKCGGYFEEV